MSSNMYAGQPLTKQISQSLVAPTTLTGFEKFFRQNSNREDGWITTKFNNEEKWQNKFFVFENGVLSYADSEYSEPTSIPMDQVVSFKTDVSHGEPIILITTTSSKLKLKLTSTSEMHKWLFCFQKSVALVLTQLMSTSTSRSPSEWGHGNQNTLPSPERLGLKNPQHNSSSGWLGPQSMHPGSGVLSSDEVYAAFRRNDSRSQLPFRGGDRCSPTDSERQRYDFRHSDTAGGTNSSRDSPSKGMGSSAIPIHLSAHSGGSGSHAHHGHGHSAAHSHGQHSSHSHTGRSRAHSSLRSVSQDGFGGAGGHGDSVDKVATSYKEDAEELCLEDLLHTPSDGSSRSRSRADTGDQPSNESDDGDMNADWRSKSSNELDMEDEMMFDLDETAESRASMISESNNNKLSSSALSQQSQSRAHSSESTGPGHGDSFYSFGKALSLSLSLAAPDQHKSPSRRSSHTSHNSIPAGAASPKAAGHSAPYRNRSQYLMWESGYCSKVGIRDSQEDRFACNPNINEQIRQAASSSGAVSGSAAPVQSTLVLTGAASSSAETGSGPSLGLGGGVAGAGGYFGVYDGHGGQHAAIYLEKYLLDNICLHPEFTDNLEKAVVDSCIRTDQDFLAECDARRIYCGTTALGAFVIGTSLLVFNIGDCQAVLCSNGKAVEMNSTHKPGRQDETERIERAGGWITEEKELYMYRLHRMDLSDPLVRDKANQISWVTINRVCGEISVSRSIGDPDYKRFVPGSLVNSPFNWPDQHDQIFHADLLIPDPECRLHDIGPEDEFLVLASDGLWDVVSPDEAVKMIRAAFAANRTPSEAAEELCELSIKLGSSDNVTIVITRFLHSSSTGQPSSPDNTTALSPAAAKITPANTGKN